MRRRAGRRLVSRLAVLGGCLALGSGPFPTAGAAADEVDVSADRVVIVGVPGLLWGDVASGLAPELKSLAADSALGNMTVRAARSRTCILDGWASLGAGNRARYPAPTEDAEENLPPLTPEQEAQRMVTLAGCGQQEQVALAGLTDVARTVARIREDEGTRSFGAEPGALGEAVSCSTAIGRSSAVAVSGPTAQVSVLDSLPSDPAETATALRSCPLSLVTVPDLIGSVPAVSLNEQPPEAGEEPESGPEQLTGLLGRPRYEALAAADATIGALRSAVSSLPGETLLLVVGLSEKGVSRAQLHPLIALHPDLPPGYLSSSSTGRAPYVQLIDVAPTTLRALGNENPATMVGSAVRWAGPHGGIDEALAHLRDLNRVAVAHLSITRTFFWSLVGLAGALVAGFLLYRIRSPSGRRSSPARVLSVAALGFALLPASTHLANLTPWWHSANREIALTLAVVGCVALLVALVVTLGTRGPLAKLLPAGMTWAGPALLVLIITCLTLGLDVVLGSPMELNSLLGYNAIVAGRFVGLGNLSFGLFAAATVLGTAMLVRGSKRQRLIGVAVVGVVAVVVVGAAGLGRDFGGVLALVPGLLVLALLVTGSRLSIRRLLAVGAVTAVAVSSFALLDFQRDPDDRTHLGRFVAQLIDGQAWTVVSRKAQANLDVLTGSPVTWLIPIFAFAGWLLLWRGGRLRAFLAAQPGLRAGLYATAVTLVIGALINDSGIAVPAIAGCLVIPLLIWLVLHWKPVIDQPSSRSGLDTRSASAVSEPSRVSVNSREPTG